MKRDGICPRNSALANDFGCKKVPQLKKAISRLSTRAWVPNA